MNHGTLKKGQRPKRVTKIGIERVGTYRVLRRYGRTNEYSFIDSDLYNLIRRIKKRRKNKICRIKVYRFVES